jgi:hypothetical protein
MTNVLLRMQSGSQSPSQAQAWNDLAAFLLDGLKRQERPRGRQARLFLEFPLRGREELFAAVRLALRNRPRGLVPVTKERAAGMDEEDFEDPILDAVHQQTGAGSGHLFSLGSVWRG